MASQQRANKQYRTQGNSQVTILQWRLLPHSFLTPHLHISYNLSQELHFRLFLPGLQITLEMTWWASREKCHPAAGAHFHRRRQNKPCSLGLWLLCSAPPTRPRGSRKPCAPHKPARPTPPVPLTRTRARTPGAVLRCPPPPAARSRRSAPSEKETREWALCARSSRKTQRRYKERTCISQLFSSR